MRESGDPDCLVLMTKRGVLEILVTLTEGLHVVKPT